MPTSRLRSSTRSHTQYSQFSECGEQYRLTRVLKVPSRQAVWFPGGRAFHETTEKFDRDTFPDFPALVQESRQKLSGLWAEEFGRAVEALREKEPDVSRWRTAGRPTSDKPNGEDVDWWRTAGLEMVAKYADWRADTEGPWELWELPDGSPAIELPLRYPLGRVQVVSYVDRVLRHKETGRLLVVDLKTGKTTPSPPLQLGLYNVGLQACFPREEWGWGSYYMAREGKLQEPQRLYWSAETLTTMYERMDEAERRGLYVPNLGRHCTGCLVRQWCVPAGGQQYIPPDAELAA